MRALAATAASQGKPPMSSMRPIGAVCVRACATAMAFFVLASGNAAAVVKQAGYGITLDRSVAPQHRGGETLHAARIDRRAFEAAAGTGRTLELPGAGSAPQVARFARIEAGDGTWSWIGHVDTALGEQSVVVTFGPDAAFGTVPQRTGKPLRLESVRGHAWLIEGEQQRVRRAGGADDAAIPRDLREPASTRRLQAARVPGRVTTQMMTIPNIDVLMLYTPSMVARYGSASAVTTRLAHLAAVTNSTFYDSPTFARIRVVAMLQLNYTTAGTNGALLDLVTNPSTNVIKTQVDAWRDQYGADLVSVVRSYDNATQENCGLAWIGGYHATDFDAAKGFSVVGDGSSGGYYCDDLSFTHELGHNLGGHHDYATAGGDYGHDTYSRGLRQTLPDGSGFATIMAYPAANDTHLARFSNWKLNLCMANYCGDSDTATMVDTIDHSAYQVASFRGGWSLSDMEPRLSIPETGSIVEGNSGTRQMWIRASLDKASPNPVYFEIDAFGSSFDGPDFIEPVRGTVLTIPAGGLYRDFPITIISDTVAEVNDTFYVTLRNVSGAFPSSSMLATIVNDDKPNLSIADASVTEGDSGTKVMNFTVSLSSATSTPVTFDIATITPAGTTATANTDFVPVTAHLQIPVGTRYKTFAVTIKGDTIEEPSETFIASITNVVGAIATDGAARGTIVNDEPPRLSIDDQITYEGNSGWKQMVFTIRASQPVTTPVYFNVGLAGGNVDATDIMANSVFGNSIPVGQQARTYTVSVQGDTAPEVDEYFIVSLGSVQNAIVIDGAARGTIVNDDDPVLTIGDVTVSEGNSGNPVATFTVRLNGPAAAPVTFDIGTFDTPGATAKPGTDYVAKSQLARTIPMGGTSAVFNVGLVGDTVVEPDEVFVVTVSNVTGAVLGDGAARATITNDD